MEAGFYDRRKERETAMPIARISEVTASSRHSFQDAIEQGVTRAIASYKDIDSVVVQDQRSGRDDHGAGSERPRSWRVPDPATRAEREPDE
jgi:hypothetical protein